MFMVCFGFEVLENFQDVAVNVNAFGAVDFYYRIFGQLIQHFNKSFLVQETYVKGKLNSKMIDVSIHTFFNSKTRAVGMFHQEIDGVDNSNNHTDEQVSKQNGKHRNDERHKLLPSLLQHRLNHFWLCKVVSGARQNNGKYTIRYVIDERHSQQHSEQQPHAMGERRKFGARPCLSISRAANNK